MKREAVFCYAQINARILPMTRGGLYEDPLSEALEANGYGEVSGAGTMQAKTGEIEYCGIDVDLLDMEQGVPFVCDFLTQRGAPKGSKLTYPQGEERIEIPFGNHEGLGLYLNGTDLPAEVYSGNDINDVYDEINRLLGESGGIQGHWRGPTETALYLYGSSASVMRDRIADLIATHPLCQKSRLVAIT